MCFEKMSYSSVVIKTPSDNENNMPHIVQTVLTNNDASYFRSIANGYGVSRPLLANSSYSVSDSRQFSFYRLDTDVAGDMVAGAVAIVKDVFSNEISQHAFNTNVIERATSGICILYC